MTTLRHVHVLARQRTLVGGVLVLLGTALLGALLGNARAGATVPRSDLRHLAAQAEQISAARLLTDGEAIVTFDAAANQVCIESRVGKGTGSACSAADAPDPWLFVTGGDASGPAMIVVVDGQRRLGSLQLGEGDAGVRAASDDGGLSIKALLAAPPTDLVILAKDGTVLGRHSPLTEIVAGQRQAESAPLEPEGT